MSQEISLSPSHDALWQGCFEGPEKKLEIDFTYNADQPSGLRSITREQWQKMLDFANCNILSQCSNSTCDAYLLSESSLFVYPFKIMIKTCGTTTLLKIIPLLMTYARLCSTEVEYVVFCRKNYLFPLQQLEPHISFDSEVKYLNEIFRGTAYILGPVTDDHWYLYTADYCERSVTESTEQTLELMMMDLDPQVMKLFFRDENFISAQEVTRQVGLDSILPGAVIDEYMFTPCGYSVNALLDDSYFTVHITPEPQGSFVSFETNVKSDNLLEIAEKVASIFKPGKFTITIFSDPGASSLGCHENLKATLFPEFSMKHKATSVLEGDYTVTMAHFSKQKKANQRPNISDDFYELLV